MFELLFPTQGTANAILASALWILIGAGWYGILATLVALLTWFDR